MDAPLPSEVRADPLTPGPTPTWHRLLTNRRLLLTVASLAIVGGLAFNWSWLAAVGIAPILLAAAPCALMCALGLCVGKMMTPSRPSETSIDHAGGTKSDAPQSAANRSTMTERN